MPAIQFSNLLPRQDTGQDGCDYIRYGRCYSYSTWDSWARWVVLGVIIVGALFLFFLFSCITARRRRRQGYTPYRGTGWAAGRTPPGHGAAQYNNAAPYYANTTQGNNQGWAAPPPAYGQSQSYYGNQRGNDVELQQPQQAYGGYNSGQNAYAPPPGPPPGKAGNDGIIR